MGHLGHLQCKSCQDQAGFQQTPNLKAEEIQIDPSPLTVPRDISTHWWHAKLGDKVALRDCIGQAK